MVEEAHKTVVLRALARAIERRVAHGREAYAYQVASFTPEFMPMAARGRRPPMGERRVRAILRELVDDGLVSRRRSWESGHRFALTEEGRKALVRR